MKKEESEKKYFNLRVITPSKLEKEFSIYRLQARGESGWRGFLANSGPTVMKLIESDIVYGNEASHENKLFISGGVLEVKDGDVTILTRSFRDH